MAKVYGLNGYLRGKLGNTVFAIRNGEQMSRQYNPNPMNPKSAVQTANRAKLKLLSQLSAVMAPVIAIPRQGMLSPRNLFTQVNYPAATFTNETASINLTAVSISRGILALPELQVSRQDGVLSVSLLSTFGVNVNRVVYAMFVKQNDGTLRYGSSQVVSAAGTSSNYNADFQVGATSNVVVYAYGVRDNTNAARIAFGNMQVLTAETVAKLVVARTLLETDITLTETKAIESNPA